MIFDAAFVPAERTTEYDVLEVFGEHQSGESRKAPLTMVSG